MLASLKLIEDAMTTNTKSASILFLLLCAFGCASRTGGASGLITASAGGRVMSSTHAIQIPGMSLTADTSVMLTTAPASEFPALSGARPEVLRIEPAGTVLERAATVTIEGSFIGATASESVSISQLRNVDGARIWSPVESQRNADTGAVTVSLTRFDPLAVIVAPASSTGAIHGTVTWADSSPVNNAPIQLQRAGATIANATTDAQGRFELTQLAPGSYTIAIDYECQLTRAVDVTAGGDAMLALVLCGPSS
jgi:hypothetical protein